MTADFAHDRWVIGLDLGQANDFTAVSLLEVVRRSPFNVAPPDAPDEQWRLLNLTRLRLGTPYPAVVEVVANLVRSLSRFSEQPELVVDATGVGRPVVDMLRGKGLRPVAVSITGGRDETTGGDLDCSVPKRNLVSALLIALQTGKLKFAAELDSIELLRRELVNFKSKITVAGNESFEAWRESIHDDLVLSLALAVWQANGGARVHRFVWA